MEYIFNNCSISLFDNSCHFAELHFRKFCVY